MKTIVTLLLTIAGSLFLASCGSEEVEKQKIVFMDNVEVFEGFTMKKDYDKLMEKDIKNEAALLDSLGIVLNQGGITDSLTLFKLRKDYYLAEELFNGKFDQLSKKYTAEVSERLNVYIEEFAKEKGYRMILGSGNGNLMYVEEADNISKDLIEFINKKYAN